MKRHLDIAHEGTVGDDDRVRMSFDEASVAHLMSVLTDLYSDPILAVIREYSTNAWDSHIEADITDPIEIELPSMMRPTFVVRDHGVGLSLDEINNHYAKYGFSSKRDTDEQNGMLGLGCKSALTYTSQFTITARKDGKQHVVLVTRDSDGCGAIQLIDSTATVERNGVEVSIPVTDWTSFNAQARKFFRFWDSGSVLIDGQPVVSIFDPDNDEDWDDDDASKYNIDDDVVIREDPGVGVQHYIVMGGVPYPVDEPWSDLLSMAVGGRNRRSGNRHFSKSVIARVAIGSIDFTPSREALQYTKRTIDVVESLAAFLSTYLEKMVLEDIDQAPSDTDAAKKAVEWSRLMPGVTFRYKGVPIPLYFDWYGRSRPASGARYMIPGEPTANCEKFFAWTYGGPQDYKMERKSHYMGAATLQGSLEAIHLVGHKTKGVSADVKCAVDRYCQAHKIEKQPVYAYPVRYTGTWVPESQIFDYKEFMKRWGVPKAQAPSAPLPKVPAAEYIRAGSKAGNIGWVRTNTFPEGDVYYILSAEAGGYEMDDLFRAVARAEIVLLKVHSRSKNRFLREHTKVRHISAWIADQHARLANLDPWTEYVLAKKMGLCSSMAVRGSKVDLERLDELPSEGIDDPHLQTLVRAAKGRNQEFADTAHHLQRVCHYGKTAIRGNLRNDSWTDVIADLRRVWRDLEKSLVGLGKTYPFLLSYDSRAPEVHADYLNAMFHYRRSQAAQVVAFHADPDLKNPTGKKEQDSTLNPETDPKKGAALP